RMSRRRQPPPSGFWASSRSRPRGARLPQIPARDRRSCASECAPLQPRGVSMGASWRLLDCPKSHRNAVQMLRLLNILAIAFLVGSAIYAYSVKYDTIIQAERIVKLKHEVQREQDLIGMLRAEWAYLTRPERIAALADKFLDLQPSALNQTVR